MKLDEYKALSFDCYGTLIDWEAGKLNVLRPWADTVGLSVDDETLLVTHAENEAAVQYDFPTTLYPQVLAEAFRRDGRDLGQTVSEEWSQQLARSVPDWPAFPDSADALTSLAEHYYLIILSNVDRAGFAASNERLRGDFAAVITAEDVGAYKPSENHFEALDKTLGSLGLGRGGLVHVAQSLFHDHVPAQRHELHSVWINRRHDRPGWGATPQPTHTWTYDAEFPSMATFAAAATGRKIDRTGQNSQTVQ